MASKKKLLQAAAGAAGGAGLDIDEVFSTYLYTGTSSALTITNDIDLSGEGGLTWIKSRNFVASHALFDTVRGGGKYLQSNETLAEETPASAPLTFNSDGFTINTQADSWNGTFYSNTYASWTWRKAPKFFDVVTYTGNTVAGRTVSHNLGSVPGMIIIKRLNTSEGWFVYHRGMDATSPEDYYLQLNTNAARVDGTVWNDTAPTSTDFTLDADSAVNGSGSTYVAYLFAHNDGDGEFGPDGDQDIIKCGSYTGNGSSTGPEINLGFEPQWLLVKRTSASGSSFVLMDNMRGFTADGAIQRLETSNTNGEAARTYIRPTSTGFQPKTTDVTVNASGSTYIYMAIRRGPLAAPESATDVFGLQDYTSGGDGPVTGIVTDFSIIKDRDAVAANYAATRLLGNSYLTPMLSNAEVSSSGAIHDRMDGAWDTGFAGYMIWGWKRAPEYFDVVAYTGTGLSSVNTVSHNLGVVPEMIWTKKRGSGTGDWVVYHKGLNGGTNPEQYITIINSTNAEQDRAYFNDTAPTATTFQVTDYLNSVSPYIAYLFATVAGVSKVGSYTGTGSDGKVIDCGFSNGAKFVMIKCTTTTGDWFVFDTERGIVSGNDAKLALNTSDAEVSSYDYIDPHSSGFAVNTIGSAVNASGKSFIFYAVAA